MFDSLFAIVPQNYCINPGKLQDINPPVVQEPAWLRKFRETSRTAVIKKLTPPPKDAFKVCDDCVGQ